MTKPEEGPEISVPFLLWLGNSREPRSMSRKERGKRAIAFALVKCEVVAQKEVLCVPAVGRQPVLLHLSAEGMVYYNRKWYDTLRIEAVPDHEAVEKGRPLCPNLAKEPQSIRRLADYVRFGGTHCLYCRENDIEGGPVDIDGGCASQEMNCLKCGRYWHDLYSLSGVIESE